MKLPTDSLYKFLGVFGIILFLGSGWLRHKSSENVLRVIEESRRGVQQISEHQKAIANQASKAISAAAQLAKGDVEKSRNDTMAALQEIERYSADSNAYQLLTKTKIEFLIERESLYTVALFGTALLGMLMAIWGIYGWYANLQVFIDRKIRSNELTIALSSSEFELKAE